MFLTLRIIHIIAGVFWAGAMFFMVSFLMPAFKDVGPDGAKLSAALANRRLFVWMPVMALITIVAGFGLYGMRMAGGGWAATMEARILGIGAVAATIAFIVGVTVTRPAMMKADALSKALGTMPAGGARDAAQATVNALRKRSMMGSRGIATLLLITLATMAIARYA
ncbi:MAG: hypothetical protein P3A28_10180 [Gemmatimonadota bacterium]|nr:hypothetical protein [Gemmatimonadota bacterium]